jgi:endonuclease YncB( thermonuclease family)
MRQAREYPVATVIDVHDGDTVRVEVDLGFDALRRIWIRLLGVRAPELKAGAPALEARARVYEWLHMLGANVPVALTTFRTAGEVKQIREQMSFIRYIGNIYPVGGNGVSLNDWMLSFGYINQGD